MHKENQKLAAELSVGEENSPKPVENTLWEAKLSLYPPTDSRIFSIPPYNFQNFFSHEAFLQLRDIISHHSNVKKVYYNEYEVGVQYIDREDLLCTIYGWSAFDKQWLNLSCFYDSDYNKDGKQVLLEFDE